LSTSSQSRSEMMELSILISRAMSGSILTCGKGVGAHDTRPGRRVCGRTCGSRGAAELGGSRPASALKRAGRPLPPPAGVRGRRAGHGGDTLTALRQLGTVPASWALEARRPRWFDCEVGFLRCSCSSHA
jgi:hypothetical protein